VIKSYTIYLSHDDWSLLTDKYSEQELRVIMTTRIPSLEKLEENIVADVYAADPLLLNELISKIKSNNRIIKIKVLETMRTKSEIRALLLMTVKMRGGISELFMNKGAYYISEYITRGLEKWSLVIDDKTFKESILPDLKEKTYSLKINERENIFTVKNLLTSKEMEILYKAYKLGYFDWPKRIDLKELSEELGISKSATLQTLRRATNKLIKSFIDNFTA
jgi:predicted DNA binding protein